MGKRMATEWSKHSVYESNCMCSYDHTCSLPGWMVDVYVCHKADITSTILVCVCNVGGTHSWNVGMCPQWPPVMLCMSPSPACMSGPLFLHIGVGSKLRVGGRGAIVYSKCTCEKFEVMPPATPLKSTYTVHCTRSISAMFNQPYTQKFKFTKQDRKKTMTREHKSVETFSEMDRVYASAKTLGPVSFQVWLTELNLMVDWFVVTKTGLRNEWMDVALPGTSSERDDNDDDVFISPETLPLPILPWTMFLGQDTHHPWPQKLLDVIPLANLTSSCMLLRQLPVNLWLVLFL